MKKLKEFLGGMIGGSVFLLAIFEFLDFWFGIARITWHDIFGDDE